MSIEFKKLFRVRASFAEAPNCQISKGIPIKIWFYFGNRLWLSPLTEEAIPDIKNLPVLRAHSHRAQLASLASLSALRARDLIVALRAPFFLDLALSAQSNALRIHLSLFPVIWYWSSNQFYTIILQMMWITHILKVTKFVFEFTWNKKFNSLKALSALRSTFSS